MLSIARMCAGQEDYYLALAQEDYYLAGGEPSGTWHGSAASALGLPHEVEPEHLRRLFVGEHPATAAQLGQQQTYTDGRSRQPGWDLTFSPPKSVSVLWSQSDASVRSTIAAAQQRAVNTAIDYLETHAARTRRGKHGATAEPAKLVVATFEHGTSRAQDPQLHTHALVLNVALREDGSWGALRGLDLFLHKMAAGAVFRAELSRTLQEELGLRVELDHGRSFRLSDVPVSVVRFFSKRRAEILAAIREHGSSHPKVAEKLTLKTRARKGHVARERLFPLWQTQGTERGFGPRQARALPQAPSAATLLELSRTTKRAEAAVARAVHELLEYRSSFTERQLVAAVAVKCQAHPVGAKTLLSVVAGYLRSDPDVVPIPHGETYARYTTKAMLGLERRVLDAAECLHQDPAKRQHLSTPLIDAFRSTLDDDRSPILSELLDQKGRLRLLSGPSNDGRTAVIRAAVEVWRDAHYDVIACGISTAGAREAEKNLVVDQARSVGAVLAANTAWQRARDLYWHMTRNSDSSPRVRINRNSILVIDNAERVDTRTMNNLMTLVERKGATLVLAGDPLSLPAWRAGAPFRLLATRLKSLVMPAASEPTDASGQLRSDLAARDGGAVLAKLAADGRLYVSEDRASAVDRMLRDWATSRSCPPQDAILVSGSRSEVIQINHMAQWLRVQAGELNRRRGLHVGREKMREPDGKIRKLPKLLFGRNGAHSGDRVRFLRGSRAHGLRAGDRGSVEKVNWTLGTVTVRLDRKDRIHLGVFGPIERSIRVTISKSQANKWLTLDYAVTPDQLEGRSHDRMFVLAEPGANANTDLYECVTRASSDLCAYADRDSAGEKLERLANSLGRADLNPLAHELLDASIERERTGLSPEP